MKLPVNIYIDFEGDEDQIFFDWVESNKGVLMDALLASCWEFANNQNLKDVIVMNFIDSNEIYHGEYVYQISVTPNDAIQNLDECQSFFVETEQYEKAISIKECREKMDSQNKARQN